MSAAAAPIDHAQRWMPAKDLKEMGLQPAGPEIDYGMRWGENHDIRVSFAPTDHQGGGYLYAHRAATNRSLLLAGDTTRAEVDAAWRELRAYTTEPDAYLAFAALDEFTRPLSVPGAERLLFHCVEQEMAAYRAFVDGRSDRPVRVDRAYALVVQRSARVAAEQLLVDAARGANPDDEPAIVRYRILDEAGWVGRVAGTDLASAVENTKHTLKLAAQHSLVLQATSVSQGHTTVSAARAPELEFAAGRAEIAADVPTPDL